MCERYVFSPTPKMAELFALEEGNRTIMDMESGYNIGPGFIEPVVVKHLSNGVEMMSWGLVPPWVKDIRMGYKMINVSVEETMNKISFRRPFSCQRCLVPASGFYAWQTIGDVRQPYYITVADTPIFGMAGLYEITHDAEGREIKTFTIITTKLNDFLSGIDDPMPVILSERNYEAWLDNTKFHQTQLVGLLKPFDRLMKKIPVSSSVNSLENQGEELISALN
ncbi:MAG: SOS response-associated peptidase [Candidatus Paceibacterota bacterium]